MKQQSFLSPMSKHLGAHLFLTANFQNLVFQHPSLMLSGRLHTTKHSTFAKSLLSCLVPTLESSTTDGAKMKQQSFLSPISQHLGAHLFLTANFQSNNLLSQATVNTGTRLQRAECKKTTTVCKRTTWEAIFCSSRNWKHLSVTFSWKIKGKWLIHIIKTCP